MAKSTTTPSSAKKSTPVAAKEKSTASKKKETAKTLQTAEVEPMIMTEVHATKPEVDESVELSVKEKLKVLYTLQAIDSQIDRIRVIRGELPLEVQDLEDDVAGLQTRLQNLTTEIEDIKNQSNQQKLFIKDCITLIAKYEEQQKNVRNNREFDSLNKEIQYQRLEIEHSEKRIIDYAKQGETKSVMLTDAEAELSERILDLEEKRAELKDIVSETEIDEKQLLEKREQIITKIEERLVFSYKRLRKNARNGLAVVNIERDACGGCFNKIPAQRQMEIKQHKKIIVCEYCGRVLVDEAIVKLVDM